MSEQYEFYQSVRHRYKVTKVGKVFALYYANRQTSFKLKKPKEIKQCTSNGYKYVFLYNKGIKRRFGVHRLVAFEYLGLPHSKEKIICGHKNGIKTDNNLKNIYWITVKQNAEDARKHGKLACGESCGKSKLKLKDVLGVFDKINNGMNANQISKQLNVCYATVWNIVHGVTWSQAIKYHKQTAELGEKE